MRLYIPKGLDFDHVSTEHHIEILVRGVMQNEEGQILFSKRTARATSFPRRWTLPGGKVDIIDILEGKRDDSIGPEKDSLVLNIPLPPGRRYENIFLAFQREMYEEFDVEIVRAHEVLLVDELRHKKIEFSDSSKILYHNRILIVDEWKGEINMNKAESSDYGWFQSDLLPPYRYAYGSDEIVNFLFYSGMLKIQPTTLIGGSGYTRARKD